jgi:nicotinamidase-related amidase
MDVLLVVDMQEAALRGQPLHALPEVSERINSLASSTRASGGAVVFVQHTESAGSPFEPGTRSWEVMDALDRQSVDLRVQKSLNDSFAETELAKVLGDLETARLIVTGQATDFCIDSMVRSAVSSRIPLLVASDGHTLRDRPHLSAPQVIQHHNWVWANLYAPASIQVLPTAEILRAAAVSDYSPAV